MIHCQKDQESKDRVVVELEGDAIEITTDFACIASKMLNIGIPIEILYRSLATAYKHKGDWNDKS